VVAGQRDVIGSQVRNPGLFVLDPVSATYFINPSPFNGIVEVVLVFAGNLAGLAAGTP